MRAWWWETDVKVNGGGVVGTPAAPVFECRKGDAEGDEGSGPAAAESVEGDR